MDELWETLEEIKGRTKEFDDHVFVDGSDKEYQMMSDRHWLIQTVEKLLRERMG